MKPSSKYFLKGTNLAKEQKCNSITYRVIAGGSVEAEAVVAGDGFFAENSCVPHGAVAAVRLAEAAVEARPHLAGGQLARLAQEAGRARAVEAGVGRLVAGAAVLAGRRGARVGALGAARGAVALVAADQVLAGGAVATRVRAALVQILQICQ